MKSETSKDATLNKLLTEIQSLRWSYNQQLQVYSGIKEELSVFEGLILQGNPIVVPQYVTNLLDSDMNPKEAMESPTFLLPEFSDFFQAVPIEEFSVAENVLQEVRDMGQGVTELEYLKAFGPIGLGVALTIDDNGVMYGCTHPLRRGLAEGV